MYRNGTRTCHKASRENLGVNSILCLGATPFIKLGLNTISYNILPLCWGKIAPKQLL